MTAEELRAFVNQNLKPGDSEEQIVDFLEANKWPYAYDRFQNRYSTRDPADVDPYKGFQIYIYVDESKSFVRVDVETVYAAPVHKPPGA